MTDTEPQPSPILKHLVDRLDDELPPTDHSELEELASQLGSTTEGHDSKRAWRCSQWAMKLVGEPKESSAWHSIHEIQEAYRLFSDTLFGAKYGLETDFGSMGIPATSVAFGVQVECVDNAVKVAKHVAEKDGWSVVPWQSLLTELITMG